MSDLKEVERIAIEKFLEMSSGYVCDFSDRSFKDFIIEKIGIDPYAPGYDSYGTSKANRLRNLLKKESNHVVAKTIKELAEHQKDRLENSYDGFSELQLKQYRKCIEIAERLISSKEVENVDALQAHPSDTESQLLVNSIKQSINQNNPNEALDRLHTFLMKYLRGLCKKYGIEYDTNTRLHEMLKKFIAFAKSNGSIQSEMSERIIKSTASILDAYDTVRNNQTLAHDNEILKPAESVLILSNVCCIIKFIQANEAEIKPIDKKKPEDSPFSQEEIDAAGDAWMQLEIDKMRGK